MTKRLIRVAITVDADLDALLRDISEKTNIAVSQICLALIYTAKPALHQLRDSLGEAGQLQEDVAEKISQVLSTAMPKKPRVAHKAKK